MRASVATVVPVAEITSAYPVVNATYISPVVAAYLDESGRFKQTSDSFEIADSASLSTAKADADTFTLSDAATLGYSKNLSDTATLSDSAVRVLTFVRVFADTSSLADSGIVAIQGYCDTTYFAGDYVGEFRTF